MQKLHFFKNQKVQFLHFWLAFAFFMWYYTVMELKELRKQKGLTQRQCAEYLGVPLRTYKNYENEETKKGSLKYAYMLEKLARYGFCDEEHGVLTVERIAEVCGKVFEGYPVDFCYLFGSYAKGAAEDKSDIDLLISTAVTGLKFYGLVEELRTALKKKVDALNLEQLKNNPALTAEILKDGIRIYG